MREIKFRGRPYNSKQWLYGSLIIEEDPNADNLKYFIKPFNQLVGKIVDPETIGQFTGLKDIDGKEIYEGDILNWDGTLGIVYWDEWIASFALGNIKGPNNTIPISQDIAIKMKIVSNVYESPKNV